MFQSQSVGFVASSGGHLEQLLALKPLMMRYDAFVVTEKTSYQPNLPVRSYGLLQLNRKEVSAPLKITLNTLKSLRIYFKERPRVIVTTGVLATIPICVIGKIFGTRVVYIESFAKADSPTMTGRFLYRFSDRFYVQWESMLSVYPKARYIGGVY